VSENKERKIARQGSEAQWVRESVKINLDPGLHYHLRFKWQKNIKHCYYKAF
jgi:hypothetical protein